MFHIPNFGSTFDEPAIRVLNHYRCAECGTEWSDAWDSACDDECPECWTVMSPCDSEELDESDD